MDRPKYSQTVNAKRPQSISILLDTSASMTEQIGIDDQNVPLQKIDAVKDALAIVLGQLMLKARDRRDGKELLQEYFHICGLVYGGTVRPLYPKEMVVPADLNNELWIDSLDLKAKGKTPMCEAAQKSLGKLDSLLSTGRYQDSFPPIIFVLSDGESTDGDPVPYFQEMQKRSVPDGNVLVVTAYFSPEIPGGSGRFFEKEDPKWPEGAKTMFHAASVVPDPLPKCIEEYFQELKIKGVKFTIKSGDRLFFPVNDCEALIAVLGIIGTSSRI